MDKSRFSFVGEGGEALQSMRSHSRKTTKT